MHPGAGGAATADVAREGNPMRGAIIAASTPASIAGLALAQVGRPVVYHLEYPNGGTDPTAYSPEDPDTKGCDCIGFACWCGGFDRFQPGKFPMYDGYINTDSMLEEAMGKGQWFTASERPTEGSFIVGHTFRNKLMRRVIGHIGVVVDCSEWDTKGLNGIHVVHCSPYNYQFTGNKSAIWKTSGAIWGSYPTMKFVTFNRDYAVGLVAGGGTKK